MGSLHVMYAKNDIFFAASCTTSDFVFISNADAGHNGKISHFAAS